MTGPESAPLAWRKSTASGDTGGNCVEVAFGEGRVHVRHSGNPDGPVLSFTHAEWLAFLSGTHHGEFDLPDAQNA